MNTVEKIMFWCKEKKIPVSRLEKECGFANGYLKKKLKSGNIPSDRLVIVANYFEMPIQMFVDEISPEVEIADYKEQELLRLFRMLSYEGKNAALERIEDMTANIRWLKKDSSKAG